MADRTCAQPNLSAYPAGYDYASPEDVRHENDVIHQDHINRLQDAVFNLQCLLGLQPLAGFPKAYPNLKSLLQDLAGVLPDPENPPELLVGIDYLGLLVEDASASKVRVRCTEARVYDGDSGDDDDAAGDAPIELVADLNMTGPGGRAATGAAPGPHQWWEVHLIGSSSGSKPLALYLMEAVRGNNPTALPPGYDLKNRVAAVCTDAAGNLRQFLQVDNRIYYKDAQSAWVATSATGVWTRLPLDRLVSPFSQEVMLLVRVSRGGGSGVANMNVRFPGAIGDRGLIGVQTGEGGSDTDISAATIPTDADRAIEYRVGGQASPVEAEGIVVGYIDRFIRSAPN